MIASETSIKHALTGVHPRTKGVQVGAEVRLGIDSTNDDAVWIYVVVPDERLDEFQSEWQSIREAIRQAIQSQPGNDDVSVYVRMRLASEVEPSS